MGGYWRNGLADAITVPAFSAPLFPQARTVSPFIEAKPPSAQTLPKSADPPKTGGLAMRTSILITAAIALMAAAMPARGGEWAVPAASQPGYSFNTAVSVKAGILVPDASVGSGLAGGFELAIDNPLVQVPGGKIRDQFSYNRFDRDGLVLQTLEYNPHYMVAVADDLWVGAGPGIGWIFTSSDRGNSPDMWTAQLGASAYYTAGHMLLGLESRYQWTGDERVGGANGADNWATLFKIGYAY